MGLLDTLREDLSRAFPNKLRLRNLLSAYLFDPGFKSVVIYRIQQITLSRFPRLALLASSINVRVTGAQFCVGSSLGPGLIVRHPVGIVIGGGVVAGRNLTISQGVTLGRKSVSSDGENHYPSIANDVTIGTNSVLLGGIKIGDRVTIGALTLVNTNVESDVTIVGIPSRIIRKAGNRE